MSGIHASSAAVARLDVDRIHGRAGHAHANLAGARSRLGHCLHHEAVDAAIAVQPDRAHRARSRRVVVSFDLTAGRRYRAIAARAGVEHADEVVERRRRFEQFEQDARRGGRAEIAVALPGRVASVGEMFHPARDGFACVALDVAAERGEPLQADDRPVERIVKRRRTVAAHFDQLDQRVAVHAQGNMNRQRHAAPFAGHVQRQPAKNAPRPDADLRFPEADQPVEIRGREADLADRSEPAGIHGDSLS
ncbi:hypothetical protein [Burkholderia lata]|uniref:hypothetical protein n=1 Tax=Burkholderia lata (strain ATCC 17760 / DSM 23089 / LMG 22485 / NCIMB 9086 / R18194 / 383) TaxID=482957 RepID=UPI0020C60740|nr:hypothetical protein [Burkholderia lata]